MTGRFGRPVSTGPKGHRLVVLVGTVLGVVLSTGSGCSRDPSPPPAAPSPAPPAAPPQGGTLFGSNLWQAPGETQADALRRVDATFGPVEVVRLYSDALPPQWSEVSSQVGDRPVVVSFKAPPAQVLSGTLDDELAAWFAAAPTTHDAYWVYFHEPENDVERGAFTAAEFVQAWVHIAGLAEQAGNDRLRATVVLMCWTVNPESDRDWRDYAPPADLIDVIAWDCYAHGSSAETYVDPWQLLAPAITVARELDVDWGIAETGARVDGPGAEQDRAGWLATLGRIATNQGALFVTYFDVPTGGDFQLRDQASIAAWTDLVAA